MSERFPFTALWLSMYDRGFIIDLNFNYGLGTGGWVMWQSLNYPVPPDPPIASTNF